MSARRRGSRSSQRSARFRMLSVATRRRSTTCSLSGADDRRSGIGPDRERDRERRSPPLLGLDPYPAAVLLHDVARDRQPEARPTAADAGPVDLVEPLEDPVPVRLRDPDTVVLDRQEDLVAVATDRDPHLVGGTLA